MNNLNNIQKVIFVIIAIAAFGVIAYYVYGNNTKDINQVTKEQVLENKEETEEQEKIVVHITGAVKTEGVVTLPENSRLADAVEKAGGLTADADKDKINLAYILEDGSKIKIPSKNDKKVEEEEILTTSEEFVENSYKSETKSDNTTSKKVNINKANQTELETLPGIGPSIALKIINYRTENGRFSAIEDLKKVNGIGDSKFENIKNLISIK